MDASNAALEAAERVHVGWRTTSVAGQVAAGPAAAAGAGCPPPPPTSIPPHLTDLSLDAVIGEGTFGVVYSGTSTCAATGRRRPIAVKVSKVGGGGGRAGIPPAPLREVATLRSLPPHPNVVRLEAVRASPPGARPRSLALVFEYAEHDLGEVLRFHCGSSTTTPTPLPPYTFKSLAWQLLRGLAHLHGSGIAHRDIKPANLLVSAGGCLRLADFGLARSVLAPVAPLAADGAVTTLHYRAPELLLGAAHYTRAVDAWATGCVLAELLLLRPLFGGAAEAHPPATAIQVAQCREVWSVVGPPDVGAWPAWEAAPHWAADTGGVRTLAEEVRSAAAGSPAHPPGRDCLVSILQSGALASAGGSLPPGHTLPEPALDLLVRLLDPNPLTRLSASDAVAHPYFTDDLPRPGEDAFVCEGRREVAYPPRPRWAVMGGGTEEAGRPGKRARGGGG